MLTDCFFLFIGDGEVVKWVNILLAVSRPVLIDFLAHPLTLPENILLTILC